VRRTAQVMCATAHLMCPLTRGNAGGRRRASAGRRVRGALVRRMVAAAHNMRLSEECQ